MSAERNTRRLKLRILAAVTVVILAMWALVAVSVINAHRTALDNAHTNAANLTAAIAGQLHHTLDDVSEAMIMVGDHIIAQGNDFNLYKIRDEIKFKAPDTFVASFIAPNGRLVSTTLDPHPKPVDLSDREYFRVHLDGTFKGVFIGKIESGPITHRALIPISMRLEAKDGRFLGVVFFGVMPTP